MALLKRVGGSVGPRTRLSVNRPVRSKSPGRSEFRLCRPNRWRTWSSRRSRRLSARSVAVPLSTEIECYDGSNSIGLRVKPRLTVVNIQRVVRNFRWSWGPPQANEHLTLVIHVNQTGGGGTVSTDGDKGNDSEYRTGVVIIILPLSLPPQQCALSLLSTIYRSDLVALPNATSGPQTTP